MRAYYESRRKAVFEQMENGAVLVLYSGEGIPCSMDDCCPFEANHHFFYLTGLRRENMALVLSRSASQDKTILFIEEAIPSMERWTGKRVTRDEAKEISGIDDVRYIDSLQSALGRMVAREQVTAAYFDCYRNAMTDVDSYNVTKAKAFAAAYPTVTLKSAHSMLAAMRMVKDESEIAGIREAIAVTDKGLRRILSTLAPGQMEYQAQAEFEYAIRYNGAEGTAFDTIAGSGINGCMLHYGTNHCRMEDGKLLLLDLGAKMKGYCADITRTYPVSGKYSQRQKQIYDIVLRANQEVTKAAKPGLTLKQLNEICKQVLADGLLAIGKIEKAEDIGTYYMHGVSHHLGLDTHDAIAHDEVPLAPGMVITNEPGLYIDEEEIGIRIEDDLLITQDGCEVLSSDVPRTTEEIEALMAR
ncbi:MAG: aminopeptidase P N-terminal domain-containing protein [Clostridia bacterium]|nr:aminopeptidase P N-terminal domain-containing protein [Clostridia bacterium]